MNENINIIITITSKACRRETFQIIRGDSPNNQVVKSCVEIISQFENQWCKDKFQVLRYIRSSSFQNEQFPWF